MLSLLSNFLPLTLLLTSVRSLAVQRYQGEVYPGRYIVQLKPGRSLQEFRTSRNLNITHNWTDNSKLNINSFAGYFEDGTLDELLESNAIESISEDGIMRTLSSLAVVTQADAPWGLASLSSPTKLPTGSSPTALNYTYSYDSAGLAANVDVYILDTGINFAHVDFGGRGRVGATFGGYPTSDGNGHGTHCAGSAVGARFGVAKQAGIISVKVLSDTGSGTTSDIISGINWIVTNAAATGRPGVILMALGGGVSVALDNAVVAATNAGVHVVVAAGGSGTDAGNSSPSRVPSAIVVGAVDINDNRASSSNYGSTVDIYAAGVLVTSDWIGSTTATSTLSGTSMSASYVAGLVAYLIGVFGQRTPANMEGLLKAICAKNLIGNLPAGSNNCLAQNGVLV